MLTTMFFLYKQPIQDKYNELYRIEINVINEIIYWQKFIKNSI